jgi:hypothetical protein
MAGSYVTVYHDPVTMEHPEGKAVLVNRIGFVGFSNGVQLERWNVKFTDGRRFGPIIERVIAKPEAH